MKVIRRSRSFLGQFPGSKYFDVYLLTQDGAGRQPIAAHRVVLAAVSSKLEKLFDDTTGDGVGPLVIRNIKFDVLRKIVEYIYLGTVNIGDSDDDIEDFQDGLDMLKVKVDESDALPVDPHSGLENVNPRQILANLSCNDLDDAQNNLVDSNISAQVSVGVQTVEAVSVGTQHNIEAISVGVQHDIEVVTVGVQHDTEVVTVGVQHDTEVVTVGVQHDTEVVTVGVQHHPEVVSIGVSHCLEVESVGVQCNHEAVSVGVQYNTETVSVGVQYNPQGVSVGVRHDQEPFVIGDQQDQETVASVHHGQVALTAGIVHEKEAVAGNYHNQEAVSEEVQNSFLPVPANNEESTTRHSSIQPPSNISTFFGCESEIVQSSKTKVSNSSYVRSKAELEKDKPRFKCPICKVDKASKSYRSLLDHCRKFHAKVAYSSKKIVCDLCHQVVPEYCYELHHQCYHGTDIEKGTDAIEKGNAGCRKFMEKTISRQPDQEYLNGLQEKNINFKEATKARVMLHNLSICIKCGGIYSDQAELSSHLQTVHGLSRMFSKKISKLIRYQKYLMKKD